MKRRFRLSLMGPAVPEPAVAEGMIFMRNERGKCLCLESETVSADSTLLETQQNKPSSTAMKPSFLSSIGEGSAASLRKKPIMKPFKTEEPKQGDRKQQSTNLVSVPSNAKQKSNNEWREILPNHQYEILRNKATEAKGVTVKKGGFDDCFEEGTYVCFACDTPLYDSSMKFDCGCGWPGFWTNLPGAVHEAEDGDGSGRREIMCAACGGHLGHVFRGEKFGNPLNERHCVNSGSMKFVDKETDEVIAPRFKGVLYPHG